MAISEQQKNLALDWTRKIHTLEYAHRYESLDKQNLNLAFGIPAIIISALISTKILNLTGQSECTQIITGAGAAIVAILTGLQTFLKPGEIAEKHRTSSVTYEDLRHRLEILLATDNLDSATLLDKLNQLKAEWSRLHTPNVSTKNWLKAKAQVKSLEAYPATFKLQ